MFIFNKKPTLDVEVRINRAVLESIYDECDKYDSHETGGRLIGVLNEKGNKIDVHVLGVIEPGPNAKRSAVSFFQDGNYQEQVFREIEKKIPEIEHLGNWHTHHVNGHPTLSSGDVETYRRIVNHSNFNIDVFYAILVVEKYLPPKRYKVRHYIFRRNDNEIYEIPESKVRVLNEPSVTSNINIQSTENVIVQEKVIAVNQERVIDQRVFSEWFTRLKPFETQGAFYWKGKIDLINNDTITLVVLESVENNSFYYEAKILEKEFSDLYNEKLENRKFKTARKAVREIERLINKELYSKAKKP